MTFKDFLTHNFQGPPPLLVTGAPYSGTTWIGSQISEAFKMSYFGEPWNPNSGLVGYQLPFSNHFTYVNAMNEDEYLPNLCRLASMRPTLNWRSWVTSPNLAHRELGEWKRQRVARYEGRRPLWKDPIAILASGWIVRTFDALVVLIVRDPINFVASALDRHGAERVSGISWLKDDPAFLSAYGLEFRDLLQCIDDHEFSPMERWARVWHLLISVAMRELEDHQDRVLIVRYEDCLAGPAEMLKSIEQRFGFKMSTDPEAVVQRLRNTRISNNVPSSQFDPIKDPNRNREKMKEADCQLVKAITGNLASRWYPSYN